MAISQEIIGQALLAGDNQIQAITKAGYSINTARGHAKKVLKSVDIETYLENWKGEHAQDLVENLTHGNKSADAMRGAIQDIDQVDDPATRAKLKIAFTKVATQRSQDLLDRAGISKISKSMRITAKIDTKSLQDVQGRIQALRDKLEGKVMPISGRGKKAICQISPGQATTIAKSPISGQDDRAIEPVYEGIADTSPSAVFFDTPQGHDVGTQAQAPRMPQSQDTTTTPDTETRGGGGHDVTSTHSDTFEEIQEPPSVFQERYEA